MTHISKNPINKEVYQEIINELYWLLTDIKSENLMKSFLGDFFTKTEKIMLAKRLAVALMISKGYEIETIKQVLKVSTGTIYRMKEWISYRGQGLSFGLKKLARKEELNDFWKKVDKFLDRYLSKPKSYI